MNYGRRELWYTSIPLIHPTWKNMKQYMQPGGYLWSWFNTKISFKNPELVSSNSFEMNQQQPIRSQVLMLDGREVRSYTIIPSTNYTKPNSHKYECLIRKVTSKAHVLASACSIFKGLICLFLQVYKYELYTLGGLLPFHSKWRPKNCRVQ